MNNTIRHKLFWRSAAMVYSCFFFLSCENDQKTIDDLTKPKAMIEEAKNIESYLSQGSMLKAKLTAPYMLRSESDTTFVEFPKSLHVDFYDSTGKVDSHLDSKYGKYYESLNKVYLRDSVLVYNLQGDSMRSPDLWWDQNTQRIYTDKKVWVKKGGTILTGQNGMESRQDLSDINIKQVTGPIDLPDSLRPQ
ncbi:MAG TPA: LPS export ABC transporter periplasmic protein LptC [Flavisolibacter sp.]|jgi:LPS export ABC transporter protein LptC|nr:LPS export ABC transporter periplasmic protein LptC [Flavisolibacter sp.]